MQILRLIFISFFLLLFLTNLYAQPYRTILPKQERYYKNKLTGEISAILIDSVSVSGADSFFYNQFTIMREESDTINCKYEPYVINHLSPTILGKKVLVRSDGYNIFFTKSGDSIKVNTLAELNENWKLFNYKNGNYIEAKINSIDTLGISGQKDSIKIIKMTVKDKNNKVLTTHPFTNNELILSRNNGLVSLYDFHIFPDEEYQYNYLLTNSKKLTIGDIYNYEIGDEFHFKYFLQKRSTYYPDDNHKILVLDKKTFGNDSITYKFKYETKTLVYNNTKYPPFDTIYTLDTIKSTVKNLSDKIFTSLAGAAIYDSQSVYSFFNKNTEFNNRPQRWRK